MNSWILGILLVGAVLGEKNQTVENKERICPSGFIYGGEVTNTNNKTRGETWEKGPTSLVYSCYRRVVRNVKMDWVEANKQCSKNDGQLLSVNNFAEDKILTGELFQRKIFEGDDISGIFATSGISLEKGNWLWFGAGESESSSVNKSITDNLTTPNINTTYCIAVNFTTKVNSSIVDLTYTAVPCLYNFTEAICEVRVYEQVWYVYFTTNWLQILFFLTLAMLLISTCITFQIWVSRPNRHGRSSSQPSPHPPAYTPNDQMQRQNRGWLGSTAEKYSEKGKEIMGKVVFYRKPEDKQRIMSDA